MNKILQVLVAFVTCYIVAFLISWGIVEGWIIFWEYGRIYNETTIPPLIMWDIFFENISLIAIIALFISPVVFVVIYYFLNR